jgi:adenylate kinase
VTNTTKNLQLPHIIILGAPGSGKGTQAKFLVDNFDYMHASTGDLLRSEISSGSALGVKLKSIIDQGLLVSDDVVSELLLAHLERNPGRSIIFDGFPRNEAQAQILDKKVLHGLEFLALFINVSDSLIVDRVVNRISCGSCGQIYNAVTKPPRVEDVCDVCGSALKRRTDDNEFTVRERLKVFHANNSGLLKFYTDKNVLFQIDADSLSVDDVRCEIKKVLRVV